MARAALVSGGTRGIGVAISEALLAAGYRVAASYVGGNDATAKAFRARTGVPVNNAGIFRDSTLHKMAKAQRDAVVATDLNALFKICRPVIEGMRTRKFGRIFLLRVDSRFVRWGISRQA